MNCIALVLGVVQSLATLVRSLSASVSTVAEQLRRSYRCVASTALFAGAVTGGCTAYAVEAVNMQSSRYEATSVVAPVAHTLADANPASAVHVVARGENLWTIVRNHYRSSSPKETTRLVEYVVAANTLANPSISIDNRSVRNGHHSILPDGIAGDCLVPGERLTLPSIVLSESVPVSLSVVAPGVVAPVQQETEVSVPESSSSLPYIAVGASLLAAALAGSTFFKTKEVSLFISSRDDSSRTPRTGIEAAIELYLGNYAHGDGRDTTVKDILAATKVSSYQLYKTLRERNLSTRRDIANRARDYVIEKAAALKQQGFDFKEAATRHGFSSAAFKPYVL